MGLTVPCATALEDILFEAGHLTAVSDLLRHRSHYITLLGFLRGSNSLHWFVDSRVVSFLAQLGASPLSD